MADFELGPISLYKEPPTWTDPETGFKHALISEIDPNAPLLGQERVVGVIAGIGDDPFDNVGHVNAFNEKEATAWLKRWARRVLSERPDVISASLYLFWSEWQSGKRVEQCRRVPLETKPCS